VTRVVRHDRRGLGLLLTAAAVLLGGAWFAGLEPTHPAEAPVQEGGELRRRFDAAVLLLHSRQYRDAQSSLQRVIELAPQLPEAHANMGFALLGLQQAAPAREAFERALALKADQANAYYGLALAHEAGGDLELALGAMRSYLHLARNESEAHLRRARAAVWEWESQLAQRRGAARP
jgi:tetratricopeptide (TPR) repeat protein